MEVLYEKVDTVVERNRKCRIPKEPGLEAQRPRSGPVESRQFFDHLDGSTNGVLGTLEAGHDCVADRLDDGAGLFPDDLVQDLEVLANKKIRIHVTNAFIQRSRLLQIGEQVSHV